MNNFTKRFGEHKAVDDILFSVEESPIFAFLGLNGTGKSSPAFASIDLITQIIPVKKF